MFFGGGFPFDEMGGGPPGRRGSNKNVDTTKFYKLLEVEKTATENEIKKAYKKMAIKHHPDKGGSEEKFKEITRAYEVLSDSKMRQKYDAGGEEALEENGRGDPSDIFSEIFGGGRGGGRSSRRQKTKDVVQPLKVTLEQIYNGQTKKMAITRQVIDKKKGVITCQECGGRGVKVEVIRMGPMIQQMQSACASCGGEGKTFKTKQEREVLEVHIQKGSPDGHKVVFREMADEHPEADTGDVIFVLKQQEHEVFKRKGADLFVEKNISLVEALCGFTMELTHLDGRKLIIKTKPGELIKPMPQGFDPLENVENKMEWEEFENCDCPDVQNAAQADTDDIDTLKKACETQLKRKGIDVGCFVVQNGKASFKVCSREEAMEGKKTKKGCTMYVLRDVNAFDSKRVMKAVKDEGMPTVKNPFICGNLFLVITIEFPTSLTPDAQTKIRQFLPPALNSTTLKDGQEGVETHFITDIDPVASHNSNKVNMKAGGEAYDDSDDERGGGGGGFGGAQQVQCQQQ